MWVTCLLASVFLILPKEPPPQIASGAAAVESPGPASDREADYQERLGDLSDEDAQGHYDLGLWCKKKRLEERAREQFLKVIEIDPDHRAAREALGQARYKEEWLPEKEAKAKEREDVGWDFKGKVETEHFVIYYGNLRKAKLEETVRKLSVYGEELYSIFNETFGEVMDFGRAPPYRVYVFATKDQYRTYRLERGSGLVETLFAQYDPMTRTAYMCKEGSSNRFLIQSFVHENTHALCGRLMTSGNWKSTWLLEGWADYMALSVDYKKKTLKLGKVTQTEKSRHPDMVKRLLKAGKLIPLADLIEMNRAAFSQQGLRSYPQAWALFHFLRHSGGGQYREGFTRYIRSVAEGKRGKEVFVETVGPIQKIEKEWRRYVRTLSSSSVK